MKTAVEWLEVEIVKLENKYGIPGEIYQLCEKAKEMEKQQIIDAYRADLHPCSDEDAEQYYNETFNNASRN